MGTRSPAVEFRAPRVVEPPPSRYVADPTRGEPVGMTKAERYHLRTMESRLEYLDHAIASEPNSRFNGGRRAEREALRWALRRIAQIEQDEQAEEPPTFVDEGWWHPNVKSGQVHEHPEHPGRSWSLASHRLCQPVYTHREERSDGGG